MTRSETALERRAKLTASRPNRLERMMEIRLFEDRVKELFFEGIVHGTTHTCQGQEAVSVGIAAAARPTDTVAATYRSHGVALALGMTPLVVLGEIMGKTVGAVGGLGGSMHLCDSSVGLLPTMAIVGAGIPVAAGAALTAQVTGTDDAAIAVFGDGASNIGAFHEGLNLASIWKLPVVFVCENNVYGEYSRIDRTTPIEDIALRSTSYGIPGHIVDGQDVDAVEEAVAAALAHARSGDGPVLLEMKTYRYAGHSRADTAPYRPEGELDEWMSRDPIAIYRDRLLASGEVTDADLDAMTLRVGASIADAVEEAKASPSPGPDAMFANIYAGR
ncbi:MAG: thiamine pyrophosphate-dependent dehydrogenase E1 component subunit alpha [Actinobacteria bacterium]|nr:MAG: thiamine pyrophosphate-dependent dehydrogenase E1 component subunit alpha [Actinomycetota bacterium]